MTILRAFDDTSDEIIRASQVVRQIDGFPQTVVATYSRIKFAALVRNHAAERIATVNMSNAEVEIMRITHVGQELAVYLAPVGGAASATVMEEVIALGGRRFLFFGSCGVLDNEILSGHIAVPTAAYRDEGTSYHYLEPSAYVEIETADRLAGILAGLDVSCHLTRAWTTDAIYRETRRNLELRKAEGCRVVEMECASTAAVARFRGVDFYQFLYGADSLDGEEWDARSLVESHDETGSAIADLALDVAVRLA